MNTLKNNLEHREKSELIAIITIAGWSSTYAGER
jgi:hypothetical protein